METALAEKKFGLDLTNGRVSLRSMHYPRLFINQGDLKHCGLIFDKSFVKYLELPHNTEPKPSTVAMFDVEKLENGNLEIPTRNLVVSVQNGSIESVIEGKQNV